MKIIIPKVKHTLDLAAYDSAFAGQTVEIWVNPPTEEVTRAIKTVHDAGEFVNKLAAEEDRQKAAEYGQMLDGIGIEQQRFFALVSGWTEDEVKEFMIESIKTDPRLWAWMLLKAITMIREHQSNLKKV